MPVSRCDPNQIERLLEDDLSADERQSAEAHLDSCESCRTRLESLAAAPELWTEIRSRLSDLTEPDAGLTSDLDALPPRIDARLILNWLAPTDDPEMMGRLGPYEIQGIIGSGGMGVVLKGWDRALRRFVAIKMLAPHLASGDAARQRFLRESRAAAAVVHENVVAIHGVAEADGLPYFVMPYSRGESLQKRLDRVGPLAVEEILRIALQTARGLAAAHAQGLVHRDVKPANILLDEGVERVLLTDFGLARAVDDATLTRSGVIAGTPQYMSPEQIRAETVDTRADLFSLGATIYAMCTGHAPFRAESTYAILRQITDDDPAPITASNPDIPDWLCRIVGRLLSKDPARRFSSARELADLLESCLANLERSFEMPLTESSFSRFGIVFLVPDDSEPEAEEWPDRILKTWTGACAGYVRRFSNSRGGIALGTLTLLALTVFGLVINTEPPEVAGIWHGDDWGIVKLESKTPGTIEGTFEDTVNGAPGKLKLQWSRVERRYVGEWREGDDRFGKISLRLDGDEIRGAITTDPASKINPGTPQLADLAWFRGARANVTGSFVTTVDVAPVEHEIAVALPNEEHEREADFARLQGHWVVVEARISGKNEKDRGDKEIVELKKVDFEGDQVTFESQVVSKDKVLERKSQDTFDIVIADRFPENALEGKLVLMTPKIVGVPVVDIDFLVEKDDLKLKFEASGEGKPAVVHHYILKLDETAQKRVSTTAPQTIYQGQARRYARDARERQSNESRYRQGQRVYDRERSAIEGQGQIDSKPADVAVVQGLTVAAPASPDTVAIARVVESDSKPARPATVHGATIAGPAAPDTVAIARVVELASKPARPANVQSAAAVLPASPETVAIARLLEPDSKPARPATVVVQGEAATTIQADAPAPATVTVDAAAVEKNAARIDSIRSDSALKEDRIASGIDRAKSPLRTKASFEVGRSIITSKLGQSPDVLVVDLPRQFPDDYSVVHSQSLKLSKPELTIKAHWTEGDTETIRTIRIALSGANSTAIVRLEPIQSVECIDGENSSKIGDSAAKAKFSLMQFELESENVVRVKCWAEKERESLTRTRPDFPAASASATAKAVTGSAVETTRAEAKSVSGKPSAASSSASATATEVKVKVVEGQQNPFGASADSKEKPKQP